ncbi:hypothetical protein D3C83_258700 [compost metagenome]
MQAEPKGPAKIREECTDDPNADLHGGEDGRGHDDDTLQTQHEKMEAAVGYNGKHERREQ